MRRASSLWNSRRIPAIAENSYIGRKLPRKALTGDQKTNLLVRPIAVIVDGFLLRKKKNTKNVINSIEVGTREIKRWKNFNFFEYTIFRWSGFTFKMRTEDERYIGRRSRVSTTRKLLKMVLECEMEIGQRVNPSAFSVFFVWKRWLGQMVWE